MNKLIRLLITLITVSVLWGCTSSSEQPTSPTPIPLTPEPNSTPVSTAATYPAVPQVPVIENDSFITAEAVSISIASATESYHQMKLEIIASEDVESYPNFTKDRVGQEIPVRVSKAEDISGLRVGDTISAHVSLRGDERGRALYASSIAKESGGPSIGVPLIDNDSLVTADIISLLQASGDETFHQMEIKILTSQDVEGEVNFTKGMIGQTILVRVHKAEDISAFQIGDTITARVHARGDEHGVAFYATSLRKK